MKAPAKSRSSPALQIVPQVKRAKAEVPPPEALSLPDLEIEFVGGKPLVILSGQAIATAGRRRNRRELIDRFFSIPTLKSLKLQLKGGRARLEFTDHDASRSERIAVLAEAMRGVRPVSLPLPHEEVILGSENFPAFSIHRVGAELTLWQVDPFSPRSVLLSHPLLRLEHMRQPVLDELSTMADVHPRTVYLPFKGNESLLIFVRPHRLDPALFREVLDPVLTRCLAASPPPRRLKEHERWADTNLAIAVAADYLFPPLGILSLAWLSWISTVRWPRAIHNLRRGKATVELVALVFVTFPFINLTFVPAALMFWLIQFWTRHSRRLYDSQRSRFLARYRRHPRRVWIDQHGTSLETRVEDLSSSSVITLTAGDIVPGDGVVVEGEARIDERLLTGIRRPVAKTEGSAVYAATRILDGSVRMEIKAQGEDAAAGRLARWYGEALHRHPTGVRAVHRADKMALPTLLISGVAALKGGTAMAAGTLRPDYSTGLNLSEELGGLVAVLRAANAGILISADSPLEKLLGPVCVLCDDTVAWQTPDPSGEIFADVASKQGVGEVIFFSERSAEEADRLGFRAHRPDGSTTAKRDYIAQQQAAGRKVVYVGDCSTEPSVAKQADVAVDVLELPFPRSSKAAIALLAPDLQKFFQLRAIAASSTGNLDAAFSISLVPNVIATIGAFFFASPIYGSILLTNLGTWANYLRSETLLYLEQRKAHEG